MVGCGEAWCDDPWESLTMYILMGLAYCGMNTGWVKLMQESEEGYG